MMAWAELAELGATLAQRAGPDPPAVYDRRIDADGFGETSDPSLQRHVRHQALLRAYQARYLLLPGTAAAGSIVERLQRHYAPDVMATLEQWRVPLEAELCAPLVSAARTGTDGDSDVLRYAEQLIAQMRATTPASNPWIDFLRAAPERTHYYRNFLMQSSADLLAEASASALGVIGEFGTVQSALFRILVDEFGFGVHERKHSVLYRALMRDFDLVDEYNGYWQLFDTATLQLHNAIHYLFQNPRNIFLQIGFLLYAETAYQRSTLEHFRYLQAFHPQVDARYFREHAHIDLHHTRMVVDDVIKPLLASYGPEVGHEIIVGAELTRRVFDKAGAHLLAVSQAFDAAVEAGQARYGMVPRGDLGKCVTPAMASLARGREGHIQVGGIGVLHAPHAFANFPEGAIGRWFSA